MKSEYINGLVIYRTNRGHFKRMFFGHRQPDPIPNDVVHPGTKQKAGAAGARYRGLHGGNGGLYRKKVLLKHKMKDQMQ